MKCYAASISGYGLNRVEGEGGTAMLTLSEPKAGMAELADAADSKSADLRVLGVRLPLPAP